MWQLSLDLVVVESPAADAWQSEDVRLPRSVQEIADVIGREQALLLIDRLPSCEKRDSRYPGRTRRALMLYVPKSLRDTDLLVQVLGWEDAGRMVRHFGGEILWPAACAEARRRARDRSIRELVAQGVPKAEVAQLMGMSVRHVRGVASEIPPEVRCA